MRPGDSVTVVLHGTVVEDNGGTVAVQFDDYPDCDGDFFAREVSTANVVFLTDMGVRTMAALAMAQRDALMRGYVEMPHDRRQMVLAALASLGGILLALGVEVDPAPESEE